MNKQTEALKLALEALRNGCILIENYTREGYEGEFDDAITALREALMSVPDGAEPPKLILDAYRIDTEFFGLDENAKDHPNSVALYRLAEQPAQQQSAERGEPVQNEQAAFEAWASEQIGFGTADRPINYALGATRDAWKVWQARAALTPPASKPLTDEQIMEMYNEPRSDAEMLEFARAIEAAHGIGEQK